MRVEKRSIIKEQRSKRSEGKVKLPNMQIKISKSEKEEETAEETEELPKSTRNKGALRQLTAGCLANLTLINAGLQFGWPAVSLPDLQDEDAKLWVSSSEGAWIVCALSMGACLGPIISALLVNKLGRKWTLLSTIVPNVSCWCLVYLARSSEMLFLARFVGGIGLGATYSTVPMYLGEIAEKKIRGALGCILCIMVATGNLTTYAIGPWISIPMLALIDIVPSIIFFCTFVWMPETPYYYLLKGELKQAEKALIWLRGTDRVTVELQGMYNLTKFEQRYKGGITEIVTISGNRRATLIVLVAIGAQQLSGLLALVAYSGLIFEETSYSIEPDLVVGMCGLVTLVFNVLAFFIIDKVGRKPLLLLSSMGTTVCLVLLGTYYHYRSMGTDVDSVFWLPILSVMSFYAFYAIGLGPIPFAIMSEVYPTNVKAWATMVVSIYGSLLSVGVSKIYQVVADEWGEHVIFYSFATIEAIFATLIAFLVFETKGKSFEEIQLRLNRKPVRDNSSPTKVQPFFIDSEENLARSY